MSCAKLLFHFITLSLFHFFTFSNINYSRANKLGTTPVNQVRWSEPALTRRTPCSPRRLLGGSLVCRVIGNPGDPQKFAGSLVNPANKFAGGLPRVQLRRFAGKPQQGPEVPSAHHGEVVPGFNKDSLTRPVNTTASGALPSMPQHCETPYSPSMQPYMVYESGPVQQDVFPCPLHKVGSKDPVLLSQHDR